MSDLSPLSVEERKSNFGAVRSVDDHTGHRGLIITRDRLCDIFSRRPVAA
jgi:hypothetical protein